MGTDFPDGLCIQQLLWIVNNLISQPGGLIDFQKVIDFDYSGKSDQQIWSSGQFSIENSSFISFSDILCLFNL